jgi:hypothetical protein
VLSDRKAIVTLHGKWIVAVGAATVAAVAWYGIACWGQSRWPGGSSVVGLTYGVIAAAIIVFECLLGLRRTRLFRTARWLGSAQLWMKAHIWLGLLAVPLVVMHSGLDWGGWLSTLLAGTFGLVTASGLFGLWMQNVIPRRLLEAVPDETIYSEIDQVAQQLAADARRLVGLHSLASDVDSPEASANSRRKQPRVVSGAARKVGTSVEISPRPRYELAPEAIAPPALQNAVVQDIEPFLLSGRSERQALQLAQRCGWYFEELRRRIDAPESQTVVSKLEQLCERRRQMNLQQTLHFWLHGWLNVHLPLAAALLILLVGHVWFALRYS